MDETDSKSDFKMRTEILMLVATIVLGGIALIVRYIAGSVSRQNKNNNQNIGEDGERKNNDVTIDSLNDQSENRGSTTSNNDGANNQTSGGKRAKNKKRREAQQEFTHPWMAGALKGHTGPVLDMNFSSNGKFLASCAEDCDLMPEEKLDLGDASSGEVEYTTLTTTSTLCEVAQGLSNPTSSSESYSSTSTSTNNPSSSIMSSSSESSSSQVRSDGLSSPQDRTSLSRRQRKNRTRVPREQQHCDRDDDNDDDNQLSSSPPRHRHHRSHHQELNSRHFHQESPTRDSTDSASTTIQQKNLNQNSYCVGQSQQSNDSKISKDSSNTTKESSNSSISNEEISGIDTNNPNGGILTYALLINSVSIQRDEMNYLSEAALIALMRRYTLDEMQLAHLGYPFEDHNYPGYAFILNHQYPSGHRHRNRQHKLNANAREFIPRNNKSKCSNATESEVDSGNGSGSSVESSDLEPECSSDSEKNANISESSPSSSSSSSSGYNDESRRDSGSSAESWVSTYPVMFSIVERSCVRCHKSFYVNRDTGMYTSEEVCVHHWGKLRYVHDRRQSGIWECCKGKEESSGCTVARMHVWTGLSPGYNGPFEGYVRTRPSQVIVEHGNYGVYALDCEMCFTRRGLELTKVTLVDMDGVIIYDTLVKPDVEVIDYNTRFSGITENDLANVTTNLRDVQEDLMNFVHAETILIGHGLENDLRALRLLHTSVVDTSIAFPHHMGYPYRNSLKTLARTVLRREIQVAEHDSIEDARIAIDLMLRRLQLDFY